SDAGCENLRLGSPGQFSLITAEHAIEAVAIGRDGIRCRSGLAQREEVLGQSCPIRRGEVIFIFHTIAVAGNGAPGEAYAASIERKVHDLKRSRQSICSARSE